MDRASARRRLTFLRGRRAERLALVALMLKGYRPVATRYAMSGGEIDLIMLRGRTVAFVEVKARADLDTARIAITAGKQQRFSRAARAWIARHPWATGRILRADAIFVAPRRWPRHVPNVFELLDT